MLVLKMTGAVCEVRTNICLMLESVHASQGVNSEVATATYEFHYSPIISTCLIAIVCLSITHS